ncbi:DUF6941 family protein [Bradyrhizobium sp. CCBAU 11361]|uniref:DUF6941 family protein n=1 Tax=Bradyrhizobium sp. CCBAU 11361 TaxID=1630812 RepID=UPI00230600E3|nr:hypothetical protein [Bradyrhizobium sp. CCBAU 11361]MDA9493325.1 hypothetical protein [Bradyrhizobium sp. CCBAU 11361]
MKEEQRPDIYGQVVFCDDVRQESTGKFIYIGVYNSNLMIVNGGFPATLTRLSFAISVFQKREIFKPQFKIRIFVPGDPDDVASIEAEIGEGIQHPMMAEIDKTADALGLPKGEGIRNYIHMFSVMPFDNFQLKSTGYVKVQAEIDGKRYRLGALAVGSPLPKEG